jgi:uncharacterized protein
MRLLALFFVLVIATSASCNRPGRAVAPWPMTANEAMGEADACTTDYAEPLVVDWKSTERADLEVAMKESVAVVNYACRSIRLLKECRLAGSYGFAGVSRKEDVIQLASRDEVSANLPLSGARLGAQMEQGSALDLALVLVGKKSSGLRAVTRPELVGSCDGATHFVRAAHVGAFALATGTRGKVGGFAELFGAGASARSEAERRSVNRDGSSEACRASAPDAPSPPAECQAAIRIELLPIAEAAQQVAVTPPAPDDPPGRASPCAPGMVFSEGRCAPRDQVSKPHRCSPEDEKDCAAQCERGEATSCFNLGVLYAEGRYDLRADPARARTLLDKACAGGEPLACENLARRGDVQQSGRARVAELNAKACEGGVGIACYSLARQDKAPAERVKLLERGCNLGASVACGALGELTIKGDGVARDVKRGLEILAKACIEGTRADGACRTLLEYAVLGVPQWDKLSEVQRGLGMKPPRDTSARNPALAAKGLWRWCHMGVESSAVGCLELGKLHRTGDGVPADAGQAAALFRKGCAMKGAWAAQACVEAASANASDAASLLARACDEGGSWEGRAGACAKAGALLEGKDDARAFALHASACSGVHRTHASCQFVDRVLLPRCQKGDNAACVAMVKPRLYAMPSGGVRLEQKAVVSPVFERGCQAKSAAACFQAGNEASPGVIDERGVRYWKKACELGSANGCSLAGSALERKDKAAALALHEKGCTLDDTSGLESDSANYQPCRKALALLEASGKTDPARLATIGARMCGDTSDSAPQCLHAVEHIAATDAARATALAMKACRRGSVTCKPDLLRPLESKAPAVAKQVYAAACADAIAGRWRYNRELVLSSRWQEASDRPFCDGYVRSGGDLSELAKAR